MKKFAFSLETARRWRNYQADVEEVRMQALLAEKQNIENRMGSLQTGLEAEHRRIEDTSFDAVELARLDAWRVWVNREEKRLAGSLTGCAKRIEAQRVVLAEARRRFRLIDRLRDKALIEWRKTSAKEQEDLAAELYLARYVRRDD
jgi:hypothetical protein